MLIEKHTRKPMNSISLKLIIAMAAAENAAARRLARALARATRAYAGDALG